MEDYGTTRSDGSGLETRHSTIGRTPLTAVASLVCKRISYSYIDSGLSCRVKAFVVGE